ncbi:MAG: CPBP family intramembrane metalloprotease [Verrucomicrobiaceae bacterium]|nr:MAG: CPBP family intramembrane metalloprotease [Verrucomicrobiaceae bacterium]
MSDSILNLLGLLIPVAVIVSFVLYGMFVTRLRQEGGRVRTDWVGIPDILMTLVLGGIPFGLVIYALLQPAKEPAAITQENLISNMVFQLAVVVGVAFFLAIRRWGIVALFGLRELSLPRVIGWSFLLLLAAVPAVIVVMNVTVIALGKEAKKQDLVLHFNEMISKGDFTTITLIVIAAAVIAPLCEEVLFRGYFYPVAKRYLGAGFGAFVTAALFAASHVNLASLPGLLVLALTFTIAYERTGSLLVPIGMHALFNAANLSLLYLTASVRS